MATDVINLICRFTIPYGAHLIVDQTCLGKLLCVEFQGIDWQVAFPSLGGPTGDLCLLDPDVPTIFSPALKRLVPKEDHWPWGDVLTQRTKARTCSAEVSALLMYAEVPSEQLSYSDYLYGWGSPGGEFIQSLYSQVEVWFQRLIEWLGVYTGQYLSDAQPLRSRWGIGADLKIVAVKDSSVSLPTERTTTGVRFPSDDCSIPFSTLEQAFLLVAEGRRPHDAYLMYYAAHCHLLRGNHRLAVIEAGSSVEMILAEAFQKGDYGYSEPRMTLGWYVGRMGRDLPEATFPALVSVRNTAMHEHAAPNFEEAWHALMIAKAIIGLYEPLP